MTLTVGEIRASVAALGEQTWGVRADLADDDLVPQFPLGANVSEHPRASDVMPLDMAALVSRPIANPLLRARNLQLKLPVVQLQAVPSVDWRGRWGGRWLATVQQQGGCDNCWAFAAAALVETMVRIEHGVWAKRSEGDLRDGWGGPTGENWVVRDGPAATPCAHGAGVTGAVDWVTANGLADPDCYPWLPVDNLYAPTADRSGRTVRIPKYTLVGNVEDTKRWIDSVGPVIAGFDAYNDFGLYQPDAPEVYHKAPAATLPGAHFMLVVGYSDGQQCWIVRNSWGTGWGIGGKAGNGGYGLVGYGECKIDEYAKLGLAGTNPDPWSKRRLHAGNIFESGNGAEHRNFEMVQSAAPHARHLWRDGGSGGFAWHAAATLEGPEDNSAGTGCVGQPAATATTYNRNFEAVYWEHSGRLRHWWMDQVVNAWHDGGTFGPTDTEGYPAFIQSNYGAPGNLEVVVRRRGGHLDHWWREGAPHFSWHNGGTVTDGVKMSGPSLVQANVGMQGNFYLVCVTSSGTMQLWWRDNDRGRAWKRGEVFGRGVGETPVCMIQGQFGASDEQRPGNFELCVAVGGHVQHWSRDNSALQAETPRADFADPGISDVIHQEPARLLDLHMLLSDDTTTEVRASAHAALGNAVLSAEAGQTVAEQIAAAEHAAATERPASRWHHHAAFGHDVKHVWGLVEGSFGFNLEVIIETSSGAFQHYYRDGEGWHEGTIIDA